SVAKPSRAPGDDAASTTGREPAAAAKALPTTPLVAVGGASPVVPSEPARLSGAGSRPAPPDEPDRSPARRDSERPAAEPREATQPRRTLTTAEIVERADPSVALVAGSESSGTGFLVRP